MKGFKLAGPVKLEGLTLRLSCSPLEGVENYITHILSPPPPTLNAVQCNKLATDDHLQLNNWLHQALNSQEWPGNKGAAFAQLMLQHTMGIWDNKVSERANDQYDAMGSKMWWHRKEN